MTETSKLWKPSERNLAVTSINFDIDTSTLGANNLFVFLTVPQDLEYDDGYFFWDIESGPPQYSGVVDLDLQQPHDDRNLNEGNNNYTAISRRVRVTRSLTTQTKLGGQVAPLKPELPVFLRVQGVTSSAGAGDFWTGGSRPNVLLLKKLNN